MERRSTVQRDLVLSAVRDMHNHPSAEDVFEHIHGQHPSISKATVYRNLHLLADENNLLQVMIPGEADHFDHTLVPHNHVVCIRCRRVFDVDMAPLPDADALIRDSYGIRILDYNIAFRGICPECQKNKQ